MINSLTVSLLPFQISTNSFRTLVCDLFPSLQNEAGNVSKDNIPFTTVKPTLGQEAYANMVSTIVSDVVPSIQKEYISCNVKKFFTSHAIDSNVTFRLLADSDFSASCPSLRMWIGRGMIP